MRWTLLLDVVRVALALEQAKQRNLLPWQGGTSGGRDFRAMCRHHAEQLAPIMAQRALDGDSRAADVAAWDALCDRGGYLPVDRLVAAESTKWRVTLAVLALEHLTPAQRDEAIRQVRERNGTLLGEVEDDNG